MAGLVGKTLLNHYRVDEYLASGGMGTVFKVWDLQRGVPLAMKVLHADLADDPATLHRFQREANALKKLAHPNIVPFYGLHQAEGVTFLLMGYVDGPPLKKLLTDAGGRFSIRHAVHYLQPVCAALGFAHASGVVHCDVKPGNVMVSSGGAVYLADFGIARHADSTTTTLAGAGSPAYMAPEQILARELTPAADVYALGVMLFEMLTGQRPFRGDAGGSTGSAAERIRAAHLTLPPPDPRSLNPQIPAALAAVVLRSLEKDPARRYPTAPAFFEAVCAAAGIQPEMAAIPEPPAVVSVQPLRTRKTGLWLLGAAVVVVLVGAFAVLGGGGGDPPGAFRVVEQPLPESETAGEVALSPVDAAKPHPQEVTHTPTARPTRTPTVQPSRTPTATLVNPGVLPACTSAGLSWVSPTDGMTLVCVPAGTFYYGPGNTLTTLDAFWIDQTEVTIGMYRKCVQDGACSTPYPSEKADEPINYYDTGRGDDYPVTRVTWEQADQYCTWTGRRLLTTQEWQKAARGSSDQRIYPWGDWISCSEANFLGCTYSYEPVGSYSLGASPYGALDMSGNVYEWVNSSCNEGTTGYMIMGGSWNDSGERAKVYANLCRSPDIHSSKLGFRCGLTP